MTDTTTNPAKYEGPAPDWLALARDAFTASTSYFDANVRQQIEADLRQAQGMHPVGSKYLADKSRSRLFRPKTRATIRKNEAACAEAFFTSNDVVSVKPQSDNDPVQQASAAVMGELLQYRLTKTIPWYLTLLGAFQDAQTVGVVASYQYWEFNAAKGLDQPAIRLIPIENLRFDPGASWTDPVGTSPYLIELIPMYVAQVKSRMRNPDPKTGAPKWHTLPDAIILTATTTYGDTIRMQREGARTDSKFQPQANNNFNIVWIHKNIVEVDDIDYVYYTLGSEHLLSDPVPLQQVYFHGRRPYVIGTSVVETHKLYPSGVPRLTHDVQAEINEVANQRIDNVKLALNKRYFARRGKQVDLRSVTRNVPGSVTLMQDLDDVKIVEFNDVTASSYKEQEVLNLDFDDVAGAFSGSSVQSNRKLNETVGGMNLLNTNANQVSNYQLRTFVETWVEPVLRQIVLLEQNYETDEMLLALCGEAAQIAQRFGIDTVTDDLLLAETTLSVNVGMGQTNPQQQQQAFIAAMGALRDLLADGSLMRLGLDVQEVIKEIFGKLGYKDGGRFFQSEDQADPVRRQLEAQIEQLQAALQAKTDPELVAAQIRKIDAEIASMAAKDRVLAADAVKKGVETSFSAMQGAEVIAAVPGVAPIADELMRAAGYSAPVPAGVDPNFPQPAAPDPALLVEDVMNRRTGIGFTPGDATTLRSPKPELPGTGVRHGIETVRADSARPTTIEQLANGGRVGGYADGGLLDDQAHRYPFEQRSPFVTGSPFVDTTPDPIDAAVDSGKINPQQGAQLRYERQMLANPQYLNPGNFDPAYDNSRLMSAYRAAGGRGDGRPEFDGILSRFADGGLIVGPGSGTSDSIPAVVGEQPLAVSNGEYLVPPAVVAALGQDFFDSIVQHLHTPAGPESGAAVPVAADPLRFADGSYVIPADVVQQLGHDFFDQLTKEYGA
ncbi:MAG: portal protein [Telluria sp.]